MTDPTLNTTLVLINAIIDKVAVLVQAKADAEKARDAAVAETASLKADVAELAPAVKRGQDLLATLDSLPGDGL